MDSVRVEAWVADAIREQPAAYVSQIIEKMISAHGEIPEQDILTALDNVVREEKALTYSGSPDQDEAPGELIHGPTAIMHSVSKDDVIVSPAEASRRGWVKIEPKLLELKGPEAAKKLLPLLRRIGGLYQHGASSTLDVLDLVELKLPGGGRLRLLLQDCPPEDMQRLGELLEVLSGLVTPTEQTQARIRITDPRDDCPLVKALTQD